MEGICWCQEEDTVDTGDDVLGLCRGGRADDCEDSGCGGQVGVWTASSGDAFGCRPCRDRDDGFAGEWEDTVREALTEVVLNGNGRTRPLINNPFR